MPTPVIRPARAEEHKTLRSMVLAARLDPTNLHWENFLVAEATTDDRPQTTDDDRWSVVRGPSSIVGCVQVRSHRDGSRELGSLVVVPHLRSQRIGTALVKAVLERESGPLYLLCQSALISYYQQFGFEIEPLRRLPWALRLKGGFAAAFRVFGVRVVVMKREVGG